MEENKTLKFRGGMIFSLVPVLIYVIFCIILFIGFKAFNMEALAVGGFLGLLVGGLFCKSYSAYWDSAIKGSFVNYICISCCYSFTGRYV